MLVSPLGSRLLAARGAEERGGDLSNSLRDRERGPRNVAVASRRELGNDVPVAGLRRDGPVGICRIPPVMAGVAAVVEPLAKEADLIVPFSFEHSLPGTQK